MSADWVFFPTFFGMVSFIVWVVVNGWQRRQQIKLIVDFNNRVLERLGSAKDFSDFLHSDGGDRLMKVLTAERGLTAPRDRILIAVQSGVVFLALGLGLTFFTWRTSVEDREAFRLISVVVLSLGLGLLLSSAASYWVARTLGLFEMSGSHREAGIAAR
jgi:hypothetical protein